MGVDEAVDCVHGGLAVEVVDLSYVSVAYRLGQRLTIPYGTMLRAYISANAHALSTGEDRLVGRPDPGEISSDHTPRPHKAVPSVLKFASVASLVPYEHIPHVTMIAENAFHQETHRGGVDTIARIFGGVRGRREVLAKKDDLKSRLWVMTFFGWRAEHEIMANSEAHVPDEQPVHSFLVSPPSVSLSLLTSLVHNGIGLTRVPTADRPRRVLDI